MADELGTVVAGTAVADGAAADPGAGGGDEQVSGDADAGGTEEGTGTEGTEGGGDEGAEGEPAEGEELGEVGDREEDDSDVADADGRRVDAKTRQDLAALKKVNPESAKRLGDMYHRSRTLMEEVGAKTLSEAVHKVRQINATLEGVGGAEGLTELQDEVGDYRNEIQQFAEGDPALLTQLYESNAESFGTAIHNGLDLLAERSPALYDKTIVGAIVSRLEGAGLYGAFDEVVKYIQEGDGQKAYDKLAEIKKWMNNAKGMADGQNRQRKEHNPERDEIERGRQEIQSEKRQMFEGGVAESAHARYEDSSWWAARICECTELQNLYGDESRQSLPARGKVAHG
jgi:hypothetical protein